MDPEFLSLLISLSFGLGIGILATKLSRMGRLSFAYAFGWFVLSAIITVASVAIFVVESSTAFNGISIVALFAMMTGLIFVSVMIQLSISISGLQKQISNLNERIAQVALDGEIKRS